MPIRYLRKQLGDALLRKKSRYKPFKQYLKIRKISFICRFGCSSKTSRTIRNGIRSSTKIKKGEQNRWGSSGRFSLPTLYHISKLHLGMMVSFHVDSDAACLDCLPRTPVQAGETLLAMIRPDRFVINHGNITYGADPLADSTTIAFFVRNQC